jgi:serine/threonine-protein kinase
VGKILDKRYRVVSHLGQGGFGRTYLAEALHRFNDRCVLKEFAPQVQSAPELQKAKELFEREAGALHKLKHPQLPGFWELFQADIGGGVGCLFLVQDYVEGQTYFDSFKSGKQLSEAEVIQFLGQMLPVLSYIHSQGVIHRDISPDNIILRKSDRLPVLIDFGGVKQIAATAISKFTNGGRLETRLGKKGYAPEEQIRKGEVYVNSDLYSLAVTALVLRTAKEPLHLYDSYKGAWHWGKEIDVSGQLQATLQKMLSHKPGDRFACADEVLQALPSSTPLHSLKNSQTRGSAANANPVPSPIAPNSNVSHMHTLVVAPAKPAPSPIASAKPAPSPIASAKPAPSPIASAKPAPSPIATPPNNQAVRNPPQFLSWLGSLAVKLAASIGFIFVTGLAGWAVMNSVIRSIDLKPKAQRSPDRSVSSSETSRTEKLLSHRETLGIDEASFNARVNQRFYAEHPELNGRQLTASPEDAALREEWYKIAEDVLANTKPPK